MAITSITEMAGIYAGHATDTEGKTGCTVIICPKGATGAVDVRGGAPATRETDLLRPEETVDVVHAVVLSGGSAFGLAASCGVTDELEQRGIGVDVVVASVPIVVGACLFDLGFGSPKARPTYQMGRLAVVDAFERADAPLPRGSVGAGTGCTAAKVIGLEHAVKTGIGQGIFETGELVCCALAAVNCMGDVVDPETGEMLAGKYIDGRYVSSEELMLKPDTRQFVSRSNTTISCVVTNARLTKATATKVAQMTADAYAHTIRPTHTTQDGDAVFVLATGEVEGLPTDSVGIAATRALEAAIRDAVLQA